MPLPVNISMVALKLQRVGRHKQPHFRIIAIDKTRDPQSMAKEILGHFDPRKKQETLVIKKERIEYWLKCGAQPTGSVHNLLVDAGIIQGNKKKVTPLYKKPIDGEGQS